MADKGRRKFLKYCIYTGAGLLIPEGLVKIASAEVRIVSSEKCGKKLYSTPNIFNNSEQPYIRKEALESFFIHNRIPRYIRDEEDRMVKGEEIIFPGGVNIHKDDYAWLSPVDPTYIDFTYNMSKIEKCVSPNSFVLNIPGLSQGKRSKLADSERVIISTIMNYKPEDDLRESEEGEKYQVYELNPGERYIGEISAVDEVSQFYSENNKIIGELSRFFKMEDNGLVEIKKFLILKTI
jgi:hypothetical protein